MSFDVLVQRTAHLERTSDANQVPAAWAVAEINRALAALPPEERASAMFNGWRDSSITYTHRRSDLEVSQERLALLVSTLRRGEAAGLTSEQIAQALRAVDGLGGTAQPQGGGGPGEE